MAKGRPNEHTEGSRYGPISTRSQATQTLAVQTQPPTQLMSHEVHQYTQLVHHDTAEHVRGDTLVTDSDVEGSGDTVVLENDDGEPHQVVELGPNDKGLMTRSFENVPNSNPHIHRDLPDSDATTEEGDVENAGYLDADAESRPPHMDDRPAVVEGVKTAEKLPKLIRSSLHEVEGGSENLTKQETPRDALVADTNGSKYSQSRPRSISSVRAAALRASGLRAAGRSASLSSAGNDDNKFDSEATTDLTPGTMNGELKNPLEEVCLTKVTGFDAMQSSPKVTVPFDDALARSPRMSTSRSKSKSVSPTHNSGENAPSEQGKKNHIDSDATVVLEKLKSAGSDYPENISAPLDPLTLGLQRLRSQASFVSAKTFEHEVGGSDARPGADIKVQTGLPSSQKARKLVFEYTETLPTNKLGRGEGNAVSKASNTDYTNALSRQMGGNHAPTRQGSMPSAIRAASANLSYLDSQEPGEESQMNALNVVDKLAWLDASCMPADDVATSRVPQDSSVKCHAGAKGLQSLAQAAQMKAVHDKLDVFDWEDSQLDEHPVKKQVPVNVRAQKREMEAPKLAMSSKKQAISHEQKTQAIPPHSEKKVQKITPDVGKQEVPISEGSHSDEETRLQDLELKPHTLLTTRLRNRTKTESRPSSKGRQSPGLRRGRKKQDGIKKQMIDSSKELETGQQRAGINIKGKVQQAAPESRRRAGRKKSIDRLGKDIKLDQQKERDHKEEIETTLQSNFALADRTSQDDAAADIWIEAFSSAKNKTPANNSVDLIKFKKRSVSQDETGQGEKKSRTVEPSLAIRDDERRDMFEQEVSREEDLVGSGSKSKNDLKKSKIIDPATSFRQGSRRVSTRLSKGEQQNLGNHLLVDELINRDAKIKQKSKRSDLSLRNSNAHGEDQDDAERDRTLPEKDEVEREPKTGQDAKQNENADTIAYRRKRGSEVEHLSALVPVDKAVEGTMLERGRKTRSQAQDKKGSDKKNAASKSNTTQERANKKNGASLRGEALQADFGTEKPSTIAGTLNEQEVEHKPTSLISMEEAPRGGFTRSKRKREAADVEAPESTKTTEETLAPAQGLKKSKRVRESADASVRERGKARAEAIEQPVEHNTGKLFLPGDVLGSLRRTRSSTSKGDSQRNEAADAVEAVQVQGDAASEEHMLKDQVVKSATKTSKSLPQQSKKKKALRVLEKLSGSSVVDEGRRRKRESSEIRVLFSHSLTVDAIKHQKKILAKLGGHLATSALECTHFISNGFVRSQNMLISMAAGKIVATTLWLESCGQAHYFVDEKNYILHDEKKEKEFGFSMMTSLANARRKPLFKDVRVIICLNTTPEPKALKVIVESAGGQVLDTNACLSQSGIESDGSIIVIANEKGLDTCIQFLVKGLKVYSEELVLHGVVTQNLDFSSNRLFEDYKQHRVSRRT